MIDANVEKSICWFIENVETRDLKGMETRSRENLENNLTKEDSEKRYVEEILKL